MDYFKINNLYNSLKDLERKNTFNVKTVVKHKMDVAIAVGDDGIITNKRVGVHQWEIWRTDDSGILEEQGSANWEKKYVISEVLQDPTADCRILLWKKGKNKPFM